VTTLRALLYADVRGAINQMKVIRRSPARALMWLLFVLVIAGGIATRIVRTMLPHRNSYHMFSPRLSVDVIACFTIFGIGLTLAYGSRMAGLFAHPAEARFIIGSPATPFIATLYVQLRDIFVNGARRGLALIYGALIYLPDRLGPGGFVRDLVLILMAFALIAALPLARQLMPPRYNPLAIAAGCAIAVLGALPLLRDLAFAVPLPAPADRITGVLPNWEPGRLLLAGPQTQGIAIGMLFVLVAALFVFVAQRARDAYPELYELSMRRMQRTERMRGRMFGLAAGAGTGVPARTGTVAAASATNAPGGVMIFVWRAWTEYRRTNSARSTGIETALLLGGGYAAGRLASGHNLLIVLPFATTMSTLLFLYALARSAALAGELRRPIFWLSDATLFERLCGLALAHTWRLIAWFVLIAIGLAAGRAAPATVAASALGGSAAVVLAVAVGYASYAVLPHEIDQRGPLMFARWISGYVLAIPPLGFGILIAVFGGGALLSIAAGALIALLESAVLIGFASWRLDRMSILLR
jgi:Putative ABC exporter